MNELKTRNLPRMKKKKKINKTNMKKRIKNRKKIEIQVLYLYFGYFEERKK